ncbi:MAG: hypothetical protein GEU92_20135 [Alphaproteobacteria bacterium]|nr:hypothetical protein [Alphaproteobacteria bacterium]
MKLGRIVSGITATALSAAVTVSAAAPASADAVSDFYKGKTVTLIVGSGEGGSYDFMGRLIARHLQSHIPGKPNIIVNNMPGASSVRATGYVYNVALKDGSVMALVQPTVVLNKLIEPDAKYKPQELNWLGRVAPITLAGVVWHTAPADTVDEAKKHELIFGASGATGYAAIIPWAMNNIVGTKFRVVRGYKSMASEIVAMERGEIQGIGSLGWDYFPSRRPEWVENRTVRPLYVIGMERHDTLPNVPTVVELANTDLDRNVMQLFAGTISIGYAVMTPPGVPSERIDALQDALAKVAKDEAFLKDAQKRKLQIDPLTGSQVQKLVADVVEAPEAVVSKMREVIKPPKK